MPLLTLLCGMGSNAHPSVIQLHAKSLRPLISFKPYYLYLEPLYFGMGKSKRLDEQAVKIQSDRILEKRLFWVLGILAFLAYFTTFSFGFVLDDVAVITENSHVKEGFAGIPKILSTFYWDGYWAQGSGIFRPLSLVLFAIEYAISPDNPMIHHAVSVILYALTCMLGFRVIRTLLPNLSLWALFAGLVFFAVHPAHTEVVANIKSRDEILALLFFLLSCYYFFCKEEFKIKHLVMGGVSFLLALLSKEGVVLLLPLLFALEFLRYSGRQSLLRMAVPGVVTILWFIWHTQVIQHSPGFTYTYQDNSLLTSTSALEQFATSLSLFSMYVIKSIYPYVLSYDYSFAQIPLAQPGSPLTIFGGILLVFMAYLGFRALRKKSLHWVLALSFLGLPLLLSSHLLMPIGVTFADRLLFTPSLGIALFISIGYEYIGKYRPTWRPFAYTALAALCLLFLVQTFMRNKAWESNASLFASDVHNSPQSARVHFNYGTLLMGQLGNTPSPQQVEAVMEEFDICLSIDTRYRDAYLNKGTLLLGQKDYPAAIALYSKALKYHKSHPEFLGGLGEAYYKSGDKEKARTYIVQAWKEGNQHAGIYTIGSTLVFEKGEYVQAEKMLLEGVQLYPKNSNLLINLGNTLAVQKKYKEAITQFEKARILEPSNMQLLNFIGQCYEGLGDSVNVRRYYEAWKKSQ